MAACKISHVQTDLGLNVLSLENDLLRITVLPDKGADIYEFIYKPKNLDYLWKFDHGLKAPGKGIPYSSDSHVAWMDYYEGGWQVLFPSGGGPTRYKGVELPFHGELASLAWQTEVLKDTGEEISVKFSVRTSRMPFMMERTLTLKEGDARLYLREKITNQSNEEMDYSWGHHPAFGAPFLAEGLLIDVPASWGEAKDRPSQTSRLPQKAHFDWPNATDKEGQPLNMAVVPPESEPSAGLTFLGGLEEGWYGLTNPALGVGSGWSGPKKSSHICGSGRNFGAAAAGPGSNPLMSWVLSRSPV